MLWFNTFVQCAAVASAAANAFQKSNVLELNADNFAHLVFGNNSVTVVEFYKGTPDDAEQLRKSANSLNGLARVGAVDCAAKANNQLCSHYKVSSKSEIKVFQPPKLTDRDFRAIHSNEPLEDKPYNVYRYDGPRDSRSINKYAVSKLRNYAATLEGDYAFLWFKTNGVSRVVMLPGKTYKSKSIAPLFKVLSSEYFGKLRFGYIPRRADGAWNMLGVTAPDQSQIVYMSEDQRPHVYNGVLTKSKVKAFIEEQYRNELTRRAAHGEPAEEDLDQLAYGMEYVTEDAQDEEYLHVLHNKEEAKLNQEAADYYLSSARARYLSSLASERGETYVATESSSSTESTTSSSTTPKPVPTDLESFKPYVPPKNAAKISAQEEVLEEDIEEAEIDDAEAGSDIELEDYTDQMLDAIDFDLAPDEIVAEGEDAVSAWREEMEQKVESLKEKREEELKQKNEILKVRIEQQHRKRAARAAEEGEEQASPTVQLPPGITPKPVKKEREATDDDMDESEYLKDHALRDFDELVQNCIRREKTCILMSSDYGFVKEDIRVLLRARQRFSGAVNEKLLYQFFVDTGNEALTEAAEELQMAPYRGTRTTKDGKTGHAPAVAIFDYKKRKFSVMTPEYGEFSAEDITTFVSKFLLNKKPVKKLKLPRKYLYYVTPDDYEVIDRVDLEERYKKEVHERPEPSHEEL